jgi:DNA polymerase III delta subunit
MLYLLHGNNFAKSREKLREIIASQMGKNPDASYFKLTPENWNLDGLETFIRGKGLFQNKYIVVLDSLLSLKDIQEELLGQLSTLKESENVFIIIEETLTKEIIKKIEKKAEKVQEFSAKEVSKEKQKEFNIFSLTDALGSRDKKRLWLLYEMGLHAQVSSEEMHRILFWQVKAMLTTLSSGNATEAGLNPFVYRKSQGFVKNYTKEELFSLSSQLVRLYQDSRRGVHELDTALERFILTV